MKPSEYIIDKFGGAYAMADAIKVPPPTIYRWKKNGVISAAYQKRVLRAAVKKRLGLTPANIIYGDKVPSQWS